MDQIVQEPYDLAFEISEARLARTRFQMHHDVHRRQMPSFLETPKDLTDASLDAMTHHRFTNLAAGRDSQSSFVLFIGMKVKRRHATVTTASSPIAPLVVHAVPYFLVSAQPLISFGGDRAHVLITRSIRQSDACDPSDDDER